MENFTSHNEEVKNQLLKIRSNEDKTKFVITCGGHLATKEEFGSEAEAKAYLETPRWDTTFALITEMLEVHETIHHPKLK